MTMRREKWETLVWYLLIFCFFYLWFTRVSVLTPYDGDDWLYLSCPRRAVPIWNLWNPAKVLPEVLMPLCGLVAAFVVMPLTGDYIGAIIIVSAVLVSAMITAYVYFFDSLMTRRFSLNRFASAMLSLLFLVLHFLVFRSKETSNNYLFYCYDLVCYYNYLIPSLLNCALVLFMMNGGYDRLVQTKQYSGLAMFVVAVYFAIFSNLPSSVILAIYSGARVLVEFFRMRKGRDWKYWLKSNLIHWGILLAWLVSAVFELNGGRASDDMGYRLSLLQGIKETVWRYLLFLKQHNSMFVLFAAAVILGTVVLLIKSRCGREQDKALLAAVGENLICCIVMFAAVVILCAVVDISYITRGEYLFGLYFYGFLILLMGVAYILQRIPKLLVALPLLLCILASDINTYDRTFMEPNLQCCDPDICIAVNNDILGQLIAADEAGLEELELHVPVSGRTGNWPHSDIVGERIAATVYKHGLIRHPIQVTVVPDMEINEKYGVPLLGQE